MTVVVDEAVWGPATASIDTLERQLARVRRGRTAAGGAAERGATEQVVSVARAAVVNVVVVATREIHARRAAETVSQLALRHPSRTIVVLTDAHPRPDEPVGIELHAQVGQADPRGAGGGAPGRPGPAMPTTTTYEQVLVRGRGDVADRLLSVVIPLLVPDLPVFVWWTGTPPIGARHFEELAALADRLVMDSADFARPERMLPELARMCVGARSRHALTDLNWSRLTGWRELLTQFFDVPAWRPLLSRLDGVRVSFAVDADGREIHPSQALLLIGWVASRLGWSAADPIAPSEAGGLLFDMRRGDGDTVRIRARPRYERGLDEGDVTGIRVEGERDGRRTEFRIHGDGRRYATLTVTEDGAVVAERILPLPRTDVVELLSEELTILSRDRVYEEALAVLTKLS